MTVDMHGRKCGFLTVLRRGPRIRSTFHWVCACVCGRETTVNGSYLRSGHTISCGCKQGNRDIIHGYAKRGQKTAEYQVWCSMNSRCQHDKNYAGRGIGICERWSDFSAFIADMGERPTPRHSIERVNNDLGYSPENCIWATADVQARNKRPPVLKTHCVNGHAFTAENVYLRPGGKRGKRCCRTCRTIAMRRFYEKQKAA